MSRLQIGVLGAGAWGTALAIAYARDGHRVTLWARDAQQVAVMQASRSNARYLPDAAFPDNLSVTDALTAAVARQDLPLLVTPIAGLRPTLQALKALSLPLPPLFWACKGFEATSRQLPHRVVAELLGEHPAGALSGPSFAKEVAAGQPTAITLACADSELAVHWAQKLNSQRLRLYATDDVVGVEVGAAVKNVMAIAAGVADGLQLGHNARAALITRGLAEMARLATRMGGRPETLMGLGGLGDLVLTCTGDLSRNRRVGLMLAQGQSLPDVLQALGHVAEGVPTTYETERLAAALQVSMPITAAVGQLLRGEVTAQDALLRLLAREPVLELPPAQG